jgi:serine/threonine protein kinase
MAGDVTRRGHRVPTRLGPGSRIADYVIEEQIGAGGMAVVFRARDEVLGRLAAVKVLSPELVTDADFRVRFLRESRAIAAVDEPHILPVYAAGESDGVLYIATRFVAGGDLARLLHRSGGTLSPERAAALIAQVAAALDAACAIGLVHRDVKPGNVLIDTVPGRPEHAYLSDFGLTKADSSMTGLTAAGSFLGTPDYCAPEQISGQPVNGRADQYALGCVAFHLLTGTVPFPRTNTLATLYAHVNEPSPEASAILAGLPPAVDAVLARALAKRPEARYASCGEFAAALHKALSPSRHRRADTAPSTAYQEPIWVNPRSQVPPSAISSLPTVPPRAPAPPGAHTKPRRASKSKRAKAIIAASAVAVLAAAAWAGIALSGKGHGTPTVSAPSVAAGNTTTQLAATLLAPGGADFSIGPVMSTDGKYVAAMGISPKQSSIYVWNTTTGDSLRTINLPTDGVAEPLAFTSDDKALIANFYTPSTKKETIYRVTLSTGQLIAIDTFTSLLNVAVSRDGSTLAVENSSGTGINMTNLSGGISLDSFLKNPRGELVPNSLRLDNAGDELIISDTNGTAYVISTTTGAVSSVPFHYTANGYFPLLSPDGSTVLAPDADNGWELWSVGTPGSPLSNVTPHDSRWPTKSGGVLFSSDGGVIVTYPDNGDTADLWEAANQAHTARFLIPGSQDDYAVFLGPDGRQLVIGAPTGGGSAYTELYVYDTLAAPAGLATRK